MINNRWKRHLKIAAAIAAACVSSGLSVSCVFSPISDTRIMLTHAGAKVFEGPWIHGFVMKDPPNETHLNGIIVEYRLDTASMGYDQVVHFWIPEEETVEYAALRYRGSVRDEGKIYDDLSEDQRSSVLAFRFTAESKKRAKQFIEEGKMRPPGRPDRWRGIGFRYVSDLSAYGWHKNGIVTCAYWKRYDDSSFDSLDESDRFVFPEDSKVLLLPWTQPRSDEEKAAFYDKYGRAIPGIVTRDVLLWPVDWLLVSLMYAGVIFI
jgi:hypothetical protein